MGPHVLVIGAGTIGLACARHLASRDDSRDVRVTLVDGATGSREASWAAAGILGAGSENAEDGPLFRLAKEAHAEWPRYAAALEQETGVSLGLRGEGTLWVASSPAEVDRLRARERFLVTHGIEARWLDRGEAATREPRLSDAGLGALWIGERRLDNRSLWRALDQDVRRRGVSVVTGTSVLALEERAGRVSGVRTARETFEGDAVVLAAGAWSRALATATGLTLPMSPVKGQMVRLEASDGFLSHVVKGEGAYAVPRTGQGIVVGSTMEETGFDKSLDAGVLDGLVAAATRLVPDLSTLARCESWAGLRPRLADGLPALGPVRSRPGLFVATGHYRNGILLCAVTGRLVGDAVLGRVDPLLAAFDPERFASHRLQE